jgi:hypothetical protein
MFRSPSLRITPLIPNLFSAGGPDWITPGLIIIICFVLLIIMSSGVSFLNMALSCTPLGFNGIRVELDDLDMEKKVYISGGANRLFNCPYFRRGSTTIQCVHKRNASDVSIILILGSPQVP